MTTQKELSVIKQIPESQCLKGSQAGIFLLAPQVPDSMAKFGSGTWVRGPHKFMPVVQGRHPHPNEIDPGQQQPGGT